jgi:Flp pilus assembly protein protease CpaA
MRLPNLMTYPLMLGGLALGAIHDAGGHPDGGAGGIGASGACVILAFLLLVPWYARGGFGAGGVKLQMGFAACVGAFYGLRPGILIVLLATLLSAAMLAVVFIPKAYELRAREPKVSYMMPVGFIMSFGAIGSVLLLDFLAYW